jgi:glycopeptide antibiotics resistance protein
MYRIFLAYVDVIPAAIVLLPLFGVLHFTVFHRALRKSILYCLFCLYISAVFSLVGIPNVTYFRPEVNLNLLPFVGILQDLKNSFLNVMLFVPLGVLLPVLCEGFRKPIPTVIFGAGLSIAVELLQMLTFRATDVNDLITNTVGTLLGFAIVKPLLGKWLPAGKGRSAPYLLIGLSFLVMFFVHPFLSPLIWDRIL